MKKAALMGFIVAMLSGMNRSSSFEIRNPYRPAKPTAKNKPSKGKWRSSEPSDYFGRRSEIVMAQTPTGPKKMKCKTALKKNFKFHFTK